MAHCFILKDNYLSMQCAAVTGYLRLLVWSRADMCFPAILEAGNLGFLTLAGSVVQWQCILQDRGAFCVPTRQRTKRSSEQNATWDIFSKSLNPTNREKELMVNHIEKAHPISQSPWQHLNLRESRNIYIIAKYYNILQYNTTLLHIA